MKYSIQTRSGNLLETPEVETVIELFREAAKLQVAARELDRMVEPFAPIGPILVSRSPKRSQQNKDRTRTVIDHAIPSSPSRKAGAGVGVEGKRSLTENAVSVANPRRNMKSRVPEACR